MGPLQDELPGKWYHKVMFITLRRPLVYRELQKSGRKSVGAKGKLSASTSAADTTSSMGPPQSIPKKGKGAGAVVPMSEDEDGSTQGQPAEAEMDIDAEMNDVEDNEEADVIESQGEDEGEDDEDEEEEEEEPADQMAVENEELRRDTKELDLHDPRVDADGDV